MNAAETIAETIAATIAAAIEKLEAQRAVSKPGPWHYHETILGLPSNTIFAGDRDHEAYIGAAADANLIVTLHRTIAPQLDWLRDHLADIAHTSEEPSVYALTLARAILGES